MPDVVVLSADGRFMAIRAEDGALEVQEACTGTPSFIVRWSSRQLDCTDQVRLIGAALADSAFAAKDYPSRIILTQTALQSALVEAAAAGARVR